MLPSANVTSRPFALFDPSLAWKPSTKISVPASSERLVNPRRSSDVGGPPSIIHRSAVPSGCATSMWIQVWGLTHSILTTVPAISIGAFASNSAANAWWATACAPAAATSPPTTAIDTTVRARISNLLSPSRAENRRRLSAHPSSGPRHRPAMRPGPTGTRGHASRPAGALSSAGRPTNTGSPRRSSPPIVAFGSAWRPTNQPCWESASVLRRNSQGADTYRPSCRSASHASSSAFFSSSSRLRMAASRAASSSAHWRSTRAPRMAFVIP